MAGPGPQCLQENFELCTPSRSDSYEETMTFRHRSNRLKEANRADTVAVALGDHARINLAEGGHARRQHD